MVLDSLNSETPNIKDLNIDNPEKPEAFNPNDYLTEDDWFKVIELIEDEIHGSYTGFEDELLLIKLLDEGKLGDAGKLESKIRYVARGAAGQFDTYFQSFDEKTLAYSANLYSIAHLLDPSQRLFKNQFTEGQYNTLQDHLDQLARNNQCHDFSRLALSLRIMNPERLATVEKSSDQLLSLVLGFLARKPGATGTLAYFRLAFPDFQGLDDKYQSLEKKYQELLREPVDNPQLKLEYAFYLKVLSAKKIEYTDEGIKFTMKNEEKTDLGQQETMPIQRSF